MSDHKLTAAAIIARERRSLSPLGILIEPGIKYTIRKNSMIKALPSSLRARRVVEWLDSEGFLYHQRERKVGVATEWAQTQVTLPNGQRVRSFVLYFPGNLDVLDMNS